MQSDQRIDEGEREDDSDRFAHEAPLYYWTCKCGESVEQHSDRLDELWVCPTCKRRGCFTLDEESK